MAVKKLYLDKRTLKTPGAGGSEENLQNLLDLKDYIEKVVDDSTTEFTSINVDTVNESTSAHGVIVDGVLLKDGGATLADGSNLIVGSTTGTKIGTATTQKLGFYNATPIVQQTTSSQTPATFAANSSGISDDTATWGGYTIGDIVAILKAYGLLA